MHRWKKFDRERPQCDVVGDTEIVSVLKKTKTPAGVRSRNGITARAYYERRQRRSFSATQT